MPKMSRRTKKSTTACFVPGKTRALEIEIEEQSDRIKGLEHDIEVLRTSLTEKDTHLQQAVNTAKEEARSRHDLEIEEIRKKHQQDLQNIQYAQNKYDQALTNMSQICEGFEQDNELLTRMIKKQKNKLKELNQARADDERRIKMLTEGIKAIEKGESEIIEGMKSVCDGQEAELKKKSTVIQNLTEKNKILEDLVQALELENKRNSDDLLDIYRLLEENLVNGLKPPLEMIDFDADTTFNDQLLQLKDIIKQIIIRWKMKSKMQSLVTPQPRPQLDSPPQSLTPTNLAQRTDQIFRELSEKAQPSTPVALKTSYSYESDDSSMQQEKDSPPSVKSTRSQSFLAPKTKQILQKMESKSKLVGSPSKMISPAPSIKSSLTFDSEVSSVYNQDKPPNTSEIKSVLSSKGLTKEFKLIEIVNRAMHAYFASEIDANGETEEPYQYFTKKSLKSHFVQEFHGETKYWYSTLTVLEKTWDPSSPSAGFAFPGGLMGKKKRKVVYSTEEYSKDALLLYVLRCVDPQGMWIQEFLGEDQRSCVLRKEGTLRNNAWLVLIRKGANFFLGSAKEDGIFKKPIIMA